MNKIKDFFKNKIVKGVSWGLVAVGSASLIIGGVSTETIGSGVALTLGILTAIGAVVAFISEQLNK